MLVLVTYAGGVAEDRWWLALLVVCGLIVASSVGLLLLQRRVEPGLLLTGVGAALAGASLYLTLRRRRRTP